MLTLSCVPGAGDPGQLRHPGGGGDSEGQQQPEPGPEPGDQAHQVREPQDLQSGAEQPQLEPAGRGQGENQRLLKLTRVWHSPNSLGSSLHGRTWHFVTVIQFTFMPPYTVRWRRMKHQLLCNTIHVLLFKAGCWMAPCLKAFNL